MLLGWWIRFFSDYVLLNLVSELLSWLFDSHYFWYGIIYKGSFTLILTKRKLTFLFLK